MNSRTISCLLITIFGGSVFGYNIGYVGPMEAYYERLSNCTAITDGKLCDWVSPTGNQGCAWSNGTCLYAEGGSISCHFYNNQNDCANDEVCVWDFSGETCNHVSGWNANEQGTIAGMMIIGAMISSFVAGPFIDKLGLKPALAVASALNIVAVAMQTGAWANGSFTPRLAVMLVGRFLTGLSVGISTVVCPMYVGDVAQKEIANIIGVSFQIFCTAGIALAALLGFVLHPPADNIVVGDMHKFQVLNGINMVLTLGQLFVSFWVISPENVKELTGENNNNSSSNLHQAEEEENLIGDKKINNNNQGSDGMNDSNGSVVPIYKRPVYFLIAISLGACIQLSGINAVMNFSPKICAIVGLDNAFLANFIVMAWNFVTTLASVFLASRLDVRWSFIGGAFLAGIACLITAVPIFPGVTDDESVRNGLTITGLLSFILIFELCIGPSFYVLAQSVFPADIRSAGCGLSVATNFVVNTVINFCFPIAVQALSGGPSGNQKKGFAITFIIFGALSIFFAVALKFLIGAVAPNRSADEYQGDDSDSINGNGPHNHSALSMPESKNASSKNNDPSFLYGTDTGSAIDDPTTSPRM